ncbi:hypothetical protein MKW92_011998 [Papaver armeniacum]|nr:hypothetical protein MKW92_011998 [Papaver armeniacum]
MGGSVKDIQSKEELSTVVSHGKPVILHFWASWCEASKQMDLVFSHLSTDFPHAQFFRVEAEEQPEISEAYAVSAVPFFVFFKDGQKVNAMEGANPSSLANKVAKVAGSVNPDNSAIPASLGMAAEANMLETVKEFAKQNGASQKETISTSGSHVPVEKRLKQLVDSHPIMLFMKGNPEEPKCVNFGSFDILTDNDVREGLKKLYNWPTVPQLFCKGEFLGGCDIAVSMHESGELKEVFRDHGVLTTETKRSEPVASSVSDSSTGLSVTLNSRIKNLIDSSSVMLFMKGKPEEPKCGFSRKVVEILQQEKVKFHSFDILDDDEVRQGLKVYSNWSSYPQLYIKGELIGGSDIVLEMQKSGELKKVLTEKDIIPKETLEDRLKNIISSSDTMLFMKGTPDEPHGVNFGSFDILTNEEVRQGLKTYSNWPTFPQLYYKGELIGGCDIVLELHGSGELKSTLSD